MVSLIDEMSFFFIGAARSFSAYSGNIFKSILFYFFVANKCHKRESFTDVLGIKVTFSGFCLDSHYFLLFKAHGDIENRWFLIGMHQLSKVEKKQFTSSLNIWPNAWCRKRRGRAE
jgi:hypothetical protein